MYLFSGRLIEDGVVDFEQVSEQIRLGSRVDEVSEEAERLGIDVPNGRLNDSKVSSFENALADILDRIVPSTRRIPAGTFMMGCYLDLGYSCLDDERPPHKVTISRDILLMKSEVTQSLYEKVTGKNEQAQGVK